MRRPVSFALPAFGLAIFLGLAGCSSTQTSVQGDPLLGDIPVPKSPGTPPAPPAPAQARAAPGLRRFFGGSNTPAALANHTDIPDLKGSRPLTMDPNWQRDYTATPTALPADAKTTAPKVVPLPREGTAPPAPGLMTAGSWATPGKTGPTGTPLTSPQDPLQQLQALGAIGLRQEPVPGGIRLSCYVPNPGQPGSMRLLETTAVDVVTAAQALLQQLPR